ncbi:MAG TPA: hypothetical protein PKC25_04410, partial [Candidatus Rifleibacterium sp.]|nr:hypothetical protein [Candidatus Rifleibacterium sp.]
MTAESHRLWQAMQMPGALPEYIAAPVPTAHCKLVVAENPVVIILQPSTVAKKRVDVSGKTVASQPYAGRKTKYISFFHGKSFDLHQIHSGIISTG